MQRTKILAVILLWLASILGFLSSFEPNPIRSPLVTRIVYGLAFVGVSLVGSGMLRKRH